MALFSFADHIAKECENPAPQNSRYNASPIRLSELDHINRKVNAAVQPATDREIYGLEEHWTFPQLMGDCEDYVVLKRRLLMNSGCPPALCSSQSYSMKTEKVTLC